ncbi:MAG: hypothetical protein ACO1NY_12625 [Pseudorhodoplanes sp.]
MNKRLEEALAQIRELSDDEQTVAAEMLFEFLDAQKRDVWLSPDQVAEIERCLSDKEPYATDEEVRETFARLTK